MCGLNQLIVQERRLHRMKRRCERQRHAEARVRWRKERVFPNGPTEQVDGIVNTLTTSSELLLAGEVQAKRLGARRLLTRKPNRGDSNRTWKDATQRSGHVAS